MTERQNTLGRKPVVCAHCGEELDRYAWQVGCGAYVCELCDGHTSLGSQRLSRCVCGWAESGRNGREELEELGETLEADELDARNGSMEDMGFDWYGYQS